MRLMVRGELELVDDDRAHQEFTENLRAFGLQPDEAMVDDRLEFYLWPENLDSLAVWLSVQTQWRYGGMAGVRTGLDYTGVRSYLAAIKHPRRNDQELYRDLFAMEAAHLDESAAKRQRESSRRSM